MNEVRPRRRQVEFNEASGGEENCGAVFPEGTRARKFWVDIKLDSCIKKAVILVFQDKISHDGIRNRDHHGRIPE